MRFAVHAAAAAAALLLHAVPAAAQDTIPADTTPRNGLRKGAWSIEFELPGYGVGGERFGFGVWEMVGARTNLGLTLGINVSGRETEGGSGDQTNAVTSAEVGVRAKRYLRTDRPVAPYLLAGAFVNGMYSRRDYSGYEETARGLGAGVQAAVGVEWFPVRYMSVAGHTGARLGVDRTSAEVDRPDGAHDEYDDTGGYFRTFTSALTVKLYF